MSTARILLVDDHPIVRKGFTALFEAEDGLSVCGEANGEVAAMAQLRREKPDLVVVDLRLADGHGLDLIKKVKARHSRLPVIVSSMLDEVIYAERALRAGASGFVHKAEAPEVLVAAVRRVLSGGIHVSQRVNDQLLKQAVHGDGERQPMPEELLTAREIEVFRLIGEGRSTRQIAQALGRSIKTIESHKENIKSKLALSSSAELSRDAVRWVIER